MRIVIVSDTHGDVFRLKEVLLHEKADLYLHAGDLGVPPQEIHPFLPVKGNCDPAYPDLPLSRAFLTPYGKLFMRHYPVFSPSELAGIAPEARIFIHGHTHVAEDVFLQDGRRILCPGSLVYPRDGNPSYMVVDVSESKVEAKVVRR